MEIVETESKRVVSVALLVMTESLKYEGKLVEVSFYC